jgi:hypothetical protein
MRSWSSITVAAQERVHADGVEHRDGVELAELAVPDLREEEAGGPAVVLDDEGRADAGVLERLGELRAEVPVAPTADDAGVEGHDGLDVLRLEAADGRGGEGVHRRSPGLVAARATR